MLPAVALPVVLITLVSVKLAWSNTGVATVTVLFGEGSGVVVVPAAVFVTVPVVALTVAWITMVKV